MATNYPGGYDDFTNPDALDNLTGHAALHSDVNDAVEAMQNELGATPSYGYASVKDRLDHISDLPAQHLLGNRFESVLRNQVIPNEVWVPVHWGGFVRDDFNLPLEGTAVTVTAAVVLTPAGPDEIDIGSNGGLFRTPAVFTAEWAVIEDVSEGTSQVVRYTGIGSGTGGDGGDQLTGVSLGNITLTTSDRIAQAAVRLYPEPLTDSSRYIHQIQADILFEAPAIVGETGTRSVGLFTYAEFFSTLYRSVRDQADLRAAINSEGLQAIQLVAQHITIPDGLGAHVIEVWQDSGQDLELRNHGIVSATKVSQSTFSIDD
jgi:hypothetical protein